MVLEILRSFFTFSYLAGALVFALVFYVIYNIYILPKYRMNHYAKQGIPCEYFPIIGRSQYKGVSHEKFGDCNHYAKIKARTDPERALCSNVGSKATIYLHDPALIKAFYFNNQNYVKDPNVLSLFIPLWGKGLATSEGEEWKAQRKTLSSVFHFDFLKNILPTIQATANVNIQELAQTSKEEVNIIDKFHLITGETVGRVFFGEQLNNLKVDDLPLTLALGRLISDLARLNFSPVGMIFSGLIRKGILPSHKALMKRIKDFRAVCQTIIDERRANKMKPNKPPSARKDMVDLLLEFQETGGNMSDEMIVDQFVTFFIAGMDSTGDLLTMSVYYLDKYPDLKAKMMEEVTKNYEVGRPVTMDELNKFDFSMAFFKEVLRVNTAVASTFPRVAIRDHMLKDISIRKGDTVNLDYFYNNYNPEYFEDPDRFDPSRWMSGDGALNAFAFTPFSAGPRNCIGQHLALTEARIIMSEFLLTYEFEVQKGYKLRLSDKFLCEPTDPILLNLRRKNI